MPWQELLPVDLRLRFVADWATGVWSMTELCTGHSISRKTGYKWLDRYDVAGTAGLHDRWRRPAHSPHARDAELLKQLLGSATGIRLAAPANC